MLALILETWGFPASADAAQSPGCTREWEKLVRRQQSQNRELHIPLIYNTKSFPCSPQGGQGCSVQDSPPSHLTDLRQQEPAARGGDPAACHPHPPALLLPLLRHPHQH